MRRRTDVDDYIVASWDTLSDKLKCEFIRSRALVRMVKLVAIASTLVLTSTAFTCADMSRTKAMEDLNKETNPAIINHNEVMRCMYACQDDVKMMSTCMAECGKISRCGER